MNRSLALSSLLLALGACGAKTNPSICDQTSLTANPVCTQTCDQTPGAPATCPAGYHCSPDGACDAACDAAHACGDGYSCTSDGYCMQNPGGSNDPGPDANCPAVNFTPMPVTPSIQLVLDQSGSMAGTDVSPTRYQAMRNALVDVTTGVVTQLEAKAYFGSELYTCNGNNDAFTIIPRALNNAGMIRTSLDGHMPAGSTPTAHAIDKARTDFAASPPPAGSPPIIVLATDGEPNSCNQNLSQAQYNQQSVDAAKAAYAAGIPVYVLAINQQSQHFQDVANAGQGWMAGQPNVTYYPVTNAQQLAAAFNTIISGVVSCDLTLTSSIDATLAMQGVVTVDGMTLTYGTDWMLVGGNTIHLVGAACASLKSTANPSVSASFPCGSVIF